MMCPSYHTLACPRQQPPDCIHLDRTVVCPAAPLLPNISHRSKQMAPLLITDVILSEDLDVKSKVIIKTQFYPRLKVVTA